MKLTQFTPEVQKNITQARVQAVDNPAAYGANQSGSQLLGRNIGIALNAYQEAWQKDQNNRVIDATNEYNRRINTLLYDEKDGLTNVMQGKDAEGMQAAYETQEKQIRADIMQQFKLDSKYANQAFQTQTNSSVTSSLSTIDKYQRQGMEVYAQVQQTENLDNGQNSIIRDPESFVTQWADIEKRNRAILTGIGMDQESQNVKIKAQLNSVAGNVLQYMSDTSDYKNGMNLISVLRAKGVDETILKKYENGFLKKEVSADVSKNLDQFVQNGKLNLTRMSLEDFTAAVKKQFPLDLPSVEGTMTGNPKIDQFMDDFKAVQQKFGWSDETLRRFIAMGDHENAHTWDPSIPAGNGDGGLGLYQFMPETAQQYGLTDRTDPHETIMAAGQMFNDSLQMTGGDLDKATLMHNGGQSEEGIRNAQAAGYLEKVKANEDSLYGNNLSEEQKQALIDSRDNAIKAKYVEIRQAQQQQIDDALFQIKRTTYEMDKVGSNPYQTYEYVESAVENNPLLRDSSAGLTLMQGALNKKQSYENAEQKAKFAAMGLTPDGVLKSENFKSLLNMIGTEGMLTEDQRDQKLQLLKDAGIGLSPTQADEFMKAWNQYAQGEGPAAINLPDSKETIARLCYVQPSEISTDTLAMIKQKTYDFINDKETNPTGRYPTPDEFKIIYYDIIGKQQLGNTWKEGGFLGLGGTEHSVNMSIADLKRVGIQDVSPADDGIGFYVESARDHRTTYVSASQLEMISNGELNIEDIGA